jgi:hypothetical protein
MGAASLMLAAGASGAATVAPARSPGRVAAVCSRSFDPYKVSLAVARSCGDRVLPLLRSTPLPGGGRSYDYGIYTWFQPPAHFNVRTASDRKLAEYGLPTHKRLGRAWYGVMGRIKHFLRPSAYLLQVPAMKNFTCSIAESCNWDGHYVSGHTYDGVVGTWTEPHFTAVSRCTSTAFSQWAGLGGVNFDSLGQAGTAFNEPNLAAHQGFIETIIDGSDTPPTPVAGFVPAAGASVSVSITWAAPNYYYLLNGPKGLTSGSIESRSDDAPDNSTAEIISERPLGPSGLTELSDFGTVPVSDATSVWSGGSAGFVNNPSHNSIQMYSESGNPLASTTNLSSSSGFTNTYIACN